MPWMIAVLALFAVLPSCSDSSGGGGGGGGAVVFPDVYNFTMDLDVDGQPPFSVSSASDPVNNVTTLRTIDVPFNGTYSFGTGDYSFAPSQINVTHAEWSEPYKTFAIEITSDITGTVDEEPTEGSLRVYDGLNTIIIEIISTGVTLGLNGGAPVSYGWDDYYDLYPDTGEDLWKREASLAASILTLIEEEVSFNAYSLELIETNDDILEDEGFLTFVCDELPITPPLGEGKRTLTADDLDVSPGVSFTWSFDYCWSDDASTNEDPLFDGTIQMLGLLETKEQSGSTETITAIGFLPEVTPGGVYYDGFKVYITQEDAQGDVTIAQNRTLVYNGGYSIMFYTE
jgi:hypothetical protein